MLFPKFGDILAELRNDKGLKQAELAKIAGVASSTISGYEQGTSVPEYPTLMKLVDFFHVNIEYLLGLSRISVTLDDIQKNLTADGELLNLDDIYSLTQEDKKLLISIVRMMREREPYRTPETTQKATGRK